MFEYNDLLKENEELKIKLEFLKEINTKARDIARKHIIAQGIVPKDDFNFLSESFYQYRELFGEDMPKGTEYQCTDPNSELAAHMERNRKILHGEL